MAADSALESVFSSYLSGKPKQGSIFIDCSTVFPDLTARLANEAEKAGISYLSSPVFGRPDAALAGKTLVVAAGKTAAKKKVLAPVGLSSSLTLTLFNGWAISSLCPFSAKAIRS